MTLTNLAPVPCVLVGDGWIVTVAPSHPPAWGSVVESTASAGTTSCGGHDIPLVTKTPTSLEGFPPVTEGVLYIVPVPLAKIAWALGRSDVVHPGEIAFDANHKPIGYKNLCIRPQ